MSRSDDNGASKRKRRFLAPLLFLLLFLFGAAFYLRASGVLDVAMQNPWLKARLFDTPATEPPKLAEEPIAAPTFDIVRVEESGDMVLAGKAEPGSRLRVRSGNTVVGETEADENGEWVLQPDKPLAAGDHTLSLRATSPRSVYSRDSDQQIALSISPGDRQPPVVALSEKGKPTRLLQGSEPTAPVQASKPAETAPPPPKPPVVASVNPQAPPVLQPVEEPKSEQQPSKPPETAVVQAQPDTPPARIEFEALDYEKNGKGGKIFMNGKAAPSSRVMLYINNAFVGLANAGPDGSWTFAGASDLPAGTHQMRADQVDPVTGKVLARAEVTFEREQTEAPTARIAQAEPPPAVDTAPEPQDTAQPPFETARADMTRKAAPNEAEPDKAATASQPAANAARSAPARSRANVRKRKRIAARRKCVGVTVRRGDTLWHISRRCYGVGARYSKIFRSNKGQIRDPDMIYPSQRLVVPR